MQTKGEAGFSAQYDSGTCTDCGNAIEAGDQIAISWGGPITRYHHVKRCPGSADIACSICGEDWYECDCP